MEVGFNFLSERGNRWGFTNIIMKSIINSRGIKSKIITQLFDRVSGRWMNLFHNEEMNNIVTASGTVRATARRYEANHLGEPVQTNT